MDAQNYKNLMLEEFEIEDGCKSLEYKYEILNTECIVWFIYRDDRTKKNVFRRK